MTQPQPKLLYRMAGIVLSANTSISPYGLVYRLDSESLIGIIHNRLNSKPGEMCILYPYIVEGHGIITLYQTDRHGLSENFWLTLTRSVFEKDVWYGTVQTRRFQFTIEPANEGDASWSKKYRHAHILAGSDRATHSFSMAINCPRRRVGLY